MGVEAYVVEEHLKKEVGDVRNHLIILAKNANGLKNIFKIMTEANLNGFYYKPRVSPKVIFDNHQDLIILSACSSSYITNPILRYDNEQDGKAECFRRCEQFAKVFKDDFYLEITKHPEIEDHDALMERLETFAKTQKIKIQFG